MSESETNHMGQTRGGRQADEPRRAAGEKEHAEPRQAAGERQAEGPGQAGGERQPERPGLAREERQPEGPSLDSGERQAGPRQADEPRWAAGEPREPPQAPGDRQADEPQASGERQAGPPDEVDITIEKLVYGGQGLARPEGRVVLVPFVLPGERVRVRVEAEKPGRLEASLVEVLEPAPGRTDPPCPFFYRCGGCQYQHAVYEVQLEQKRAILREVIQRIGKLEPPEIDAVPSEPWGYRNRTQLHLDGAGRIGYFGFGTHELVDVDRCPISSPKINETIRTLREMLRDPRFPRFLRSIELFTNETDLQLNVLETVQPVARRFFDWCAERIPGYAPGAIEYVAGEFTYRVRGRSFFQVNRFLLGETVTRALEGAEGEAALDLYSGVGLFSLPLARKFSQVTAVESSASAVGDLEFNARRARLEVRVQQARAEEFLLSAETAPDFVLADPPRAGLGKHVVRELLRLRPRLVTVVSCDPATLARDLAQFVAGGYAIERLTLMDLFPQTFHIETVTRLRAQ